MDDQELLTRYSNSRDSHAFEELTRRHAGMVKTICTRVLGNSHDAEEVTQECFLQLARNADCVRSSVVGWLHRAATSRSLNVLRSRSRRRVRERLVGNEAKTEVSTPDTSIRELQSVVAGAMTELPDELRLPVEMHYFDGQSQRDVAKTLGVNQSTISRRMQEALQHLRTRLMRAGFTTSSPAVMFILRGPSLSAADTPALTGPALSDSPVRSGTALTLVGLLNSVSASMLAFVVYLTLGGWTSLAITIGLVSYAVLSRPNWINELYTCLGLPEIANHPTYSLARWTWTSAPADWRMHVVKSLIGSAFFASVASSFAIGVPGQQTGTVALGIVVSLWYAIHAFRIVHRVYFVCSFKSRHGSSNDLDPDLGLDASRDRTSAITTSNWTAHLKSAVFTWLDVVQLVGTGMAGVVLAIHAFVGTTATPMSPVALIVGTAGVGMIVAGGGLFGRLTLNGFRHAFKPLSMIMPFVREYLTTRQFRMATGAVGTNRTHDQSVCSMERAGGKLRRESPAAESPTGRAINRSWTGTHLAIAVCASIVLVLSTLVAWNPADVSGTSLTLAAVQTSMLGWGVYRLAAHRRLDDPSLVRFAAIVVVVACFVLNSTICFANWPG